jgi:hypothetical protein
LKSGRGPEKPPLSPALMINAKVNQNPAKPGKKSGFFLKPTDSLVGLNEGLLGKIFGIILVSNHTLRNSKGTFLVPFHKSIEGGPISSLNSLDQFLVRKGHIHDSFRSPIAHIACKPSHPNGIQGPSHVQQSI